MSAAPRPHIGEYGIKTNAVRINETGPYRHSQKRPAACVSVNHPYGRLLAVIDENLIAGLRQLGTILLKAA